MGAECCGLGAGIARNFMGGDFQSNGAEGSGTTQGVKRLCPSEFWISKIIPGRAIETHCCHCAIANHSLMPKLHIAPHAFFVSWPRPQDIFPQLAAKLQSHQGFDPYREIEAGENVTILHRFQAETIAARLNIHGNPYLGSFSGSLKYTILFNGLQTKS